jgi:hypothetical protein
VHVGGRLRLARVANGFRAFTTVDKALQAAIL